MKKLINTFTRIAMLTLLFVTLTGCEKYDPDKNEISFYLNDISMKPASDDLFLFYSLNATYYVDLDALEISARVGDDSGIRYCLCLRFPDPSNSKVTEDISCVGFRYYKSDLEFKITSCMLSLDEFNVRKEFDGHVCHNGGIKKRYVYSGGNVTGTFKFSGTKTNNKEFEATKGKFNMQLQYRKDRTSNEEVYVIR